MKRQFAALVLLASATPLAGQWLSEPTPNIPRTADGRPDLSAPAPRTADGRLDLTGLWRPVGVSGNLADEGALQPWARELRAEHERNYYAEGPHMRCLPSGPAYIASAGGGGGGMRRIVQNPSVIAILNWDLTYRQIFMDGRSLEPDPLPVWMGYSVGRWDGDTLIVESNGYNDKTWLHAEGLVHTENLRVTERYRRPDFGHIEIEVTYDDPGTFDTPLQAVVSLEYAADDELLELVCNEATDGRSQDWVGDKLTDARITTVEVDPEILAKYVGTYAGIWLDRDITVEVTLENGTLLLSRNGSEKAALLPQSQTTFVCSTCQWGQPYVFTAEGDGMASEVLEVQVSGAWSFKRVE